MACRVPASFRASATLVLRCPVLSALALVRIDPLFQRSPSSRTVDRRSFGFPLPEKIEHWLGLRDQAMGLIGLPRAYHVVGILAGRQDRSANALAGPEEGKGGVDYAMGGAQTGGVAVEGEDAFIGCFQKKGGRA